MYKLKEFKLLLQEQFFRLKYSKCFYILLGLYPVYCLLEIGIYALSNKVAADLGSMSFTYVNYLFPDMFAPTSLGIFIIIFVAVFGCGEFSNHTIRGKIASGFSRTAIYFSTVVFNYIITAIYIVAGSIIMLGVGTPVLGWMYTTETLTNTLALLFSLVPSVAFITMIAFCVRSRGAALGINFGVFLSANVLGLLVLVLMNFFSVIEWIVRVIFLMFTSYLISYGTGSSSTLPYWEVTMVVNFVLSTAICILSGWLAFLNAEIK